MGLVTKQNTHRELPNSRAPVAPSYLTPKGRRGQKRQADLCERRKRSKQKHEARVGEERTAYGTLSNLFQPVFPVQQSWRDGGFETGSFDARPWRYSKQRWKEARSSPAVRETRGSTAVQRGPAFGLVLQRDLLVGNWLMQRILVVVQIEEMEKKGKRTKFGNHNF